MSPQRVQRRRTLGWRMPEGAVYVGRPSQWGNPFRPISGDHAEAAKAFDTELRDCITAPYAASHALQIRMIAEHIHELAGKDLVCWCPLDQSCHADTLLSLANATQAVTG